MTPPSRLTLLLLLAALAATAATPAAADTNPTASADDTSSSFNERFTGQADQTQADANSDQAIVNAGLAQGDAPPDEPKAAATTDPNYAPYSQPNASEIYGPPLPPGYQAKAAAAGVTATPNDPLGLQGSADSPEGFNDQATSRGLLALNSGRNGSTSASLPAAAAPSRTPSGSPRALATSSKGDGGLQAGTGDPAAGVTGAGSPGQSGPAVVAAPKGATFDVNDPDAMAAAITNTWGSVEQGAGRFEGQRAKLVKTANAEVDRPRGGTDDAHPNAGCDRNGWNVTFDNATGSDSCPMLKPEPLTGRQIKGA